VVKIIFCIWHLQGEFNGSLKLAKSLKSLGYDVCYLGIPDSEENSSQHGFKFIPILDKWFPKGFIRQVEIKHLKLRGIRLLIDQFQYLKYFKTFIHSFIKGDHQEIYTILQETNADLLVISTCAPLYSTLMGLIAYKCKIPSVYLTDMFIFLPPPKTIHQGTKDIELSNNFTNKYKLKYFIDEIKKKITYLIGIDLDIKNIIKKFAIDSKVPIELLDFSQNIPFKLPHLFLCPEELDFPDSLRERCYYAEASIDFQRQEVPFLWSKLDKDKVLIYCALGITVGAIETLSLNNARQFFQNVINAISLKKEYQLVLSVGDYINIDDFPLIPENVIIVNKAPQLALLEKASMAIIAGGIHTVKECIFCGVPMIVFPICVDQPTNADRVKYHGLGVVGNIKNASVNTIVDLVETIENDLLLQERVKLWSKNFEELEKSRKATEIILTILEDAK
jgi:UDP:flavonoid glycosyltransferase YjiC (YdhE family)